MNVDTLIDAPDKSLDYINHMAIPHFRELDTGLEILVEITHARKGYSYL